MFQVLVHVQSSLHMGQNADLLSAAISHLEGHGLIKLESYIAPRKKTNNAFFMLSPTEKEIPLNELAKTAAAYFTKIKVYVQTYAADGTVDKTETMFFNWNGEKDCPSNFIYNEETERVEQLLKAGLVNHSRFNLNPITIRIYPTIDENRLPTVRIIADDDLSMEDLKQREGLGLFLGLHNSGIWVYGNTGKELYQNLVTESYKYPVAMDVSKIVNNLAKIKDILYIYFVYRQLYKTVSVNILRGLFTPNPEIYPSVQRLMDNINQGFINGKPLTRDEIFKSIQLYSLPVGVKYNEQL